MAKDLFSEQSEEYARFRPSWPEALIESLLTHCSARARAWDCATGNGQMARLLADHFDSIEATDISLQQLENADQHPNIQYAIAPAEKPPFADQSFDLITVGQAVHWFEHEPFFKQVQRVLKPEGLLVLAGYGLLRIEPLVDSLIDELYTDELKGYWPPERQHIDQRYQSIPFPFREIHHPDLEHRLLWTADHLLGYLSTWSAVRRFKQVNKVDPVTSLIPAVRKAWGRGKRTVHIPVFSRVGKLHPIPTQDQI